MYYSKVNPTEAGKEKTFWKTFKPLFSSTCTATDKIILVENEAILTDDKEVAKFFNSYFANIIETLNIPPMKDLLAQFLMQSINMLAIQV